MHAQGFVVALVVSASAVYAAWTLMPAGWRRRLATALLQWPLPERCKAPLHRASATASGACGGCGSCAGKNSEPKPLGTEPRVTPSAATVVFHRRTRR